MALGTLSSLGFASGVLTQDMIDKLKKAEEAARVDPYTKKVEENAAKQKDLTEIKTKLLAFQTAVSSLGDATAFAARKVIASITENPPASLKADAGVAVQNMHIDVKKLAEKDVYQSKALSNETGYVNAKLTKEEKITFFQNGKEYVVAIDKNTTYKDLAEKINTASGGNIIAKVINTGEKPDGYRLTLTSKETGEDNAISFYPGAKKEVTTSGKKEWKYQESNDAKNIFKNLGWELNTSASLKPEDVEKNKKGYGLKDQTNHLKTASDAEFLMDGVKMTRPSNTITDIAVGLTLTLNKTGEINFDVQQDTEALSKAMEDLVTAYNDLVVNLNAATDFNSETGAKGTLQGVTEVNSIRSTIISTLFDSQPIEGIVKDENGNDVHTTVMLSMQDFGITMTESGTLNFQKSKFEEKMKENAEFAESFFSGVTKYKDIDHKGGFFKESDLNTDIEFKPGDFKIVFNGEVFDLGKNKDGTNFKLTGKDAAERMNNLVAHINSLGIEGLTVKAEAVTEGKDKGFKLSFHSENGSDFAIEGSKDFLKKFGLSETKITAQPIEGKGIFAQLKNVLKGMTDSDGSITKYDEHLTKDTKKLNESKESTQDMINKRYETMQNQFLQYEVILNRLDTQLKTITNMINAANQSNS
ncbi:flagellar filament capping protein FliD [Campylobacter helveticus]|uniref:flagellar filament capping protein FliD n=1 Tax=Campylobacter helveticus TaxID=28898 RepID=UPI00214A6E56|nr:flagellar filament capping protein FliD [Campylobacter helveticus]MCR2063988.1 flagellar filament capping protein FliD [Campylobacter helveticus]